MPALFLLSFDRVGKRLPKKITKGTERLWAEKEGMPLKNGAQTLGLFWTRRDSKDKTAEKL